MDDRLAVADVEADRGADGVGEQYDGAHGEGRVGAYRVAEKRDDDEESAPDDRRERCDHRMPARVRAQPLREHDDRTDDGDEDEG